MLALTLDIVPTRHPFLQYFCLPPAKENRHPLWREVQAEGIPFRNPGSPKVSGSRGRRIPIVIELEIDLHRTTGRRAKKSPFIEEKVAGNGLWERESFPSHNTPCPGIYKENKPCAGGREGGGTHDTDMEAEPLKELRLRFKF
jgi:hypothetical protein